jgi:hypothetical protein
VVTFRKIATWMDGIRSGYSAKTVVPLKIAGPVTTSPVPFKSIGDGYEVRIRSSFEDYVRPLPGIVVDQTPLVS